MIGLFKIMEICVPPSLSNLVHIFFCFQREVVTCALITIFCVCPKVEKKERKEEYYCISLPYFLFLAVENIYIRPTHTFLRSHLFIFIYKFFYKYIYLNTQLILLLVNPNYCILMQIIEIINNLTSYGAISYICYSHTILI